jgi:predicted secreted protein
MSPWFGFFVFLNAWFVALFLAFPFSIEMGESHNAMDYQAAPKKIRWKKLLIIATIIAALFTLTLAIVIKSGILPLRNME